MLRRIVSLTLVVSLFLLAGLSQVKNPATGRTRYLELYEQADRFYTEAEKLASRGEETEEKEEALNRRALTGFRDLLTLMKEEKAAYDSLAYYGFLKLGILEHYFENHQSAKKAYTTAIARLQAAILPDSLLFKPYLYLGIILYTESRFDSSFFLLKKAETIIESGAGPLPEEERLYNTLGAMFTESGNYRQAKNYFEKALSVINASNPYYEELVLNYQINLAAVLTRLEEYDEAALLYEKILPVAQGIFRNAILHNTGTLHLNLGAARRAIRYLKQVNYSGNRLVRLYNDLALAYENLPDRDSAFYFLRLSDSVHTSINPGRKTTARGQTLKQWGDLLLEDGLPGEAVSKYQEAIQHFYPEFRETGIFSHPEHYSGLFSYIPLFHTLTAKAGAFEEIYRQEKKIRFLDGALSAYQSAFALADYVERSYDSDEARLFLNRIKYTVHSRPIDISLDLYEQTGESRYLEQTWLFDQRNKGSVISLGISESRLMHGKVPAALSDQETALRSALTRLSLKAAAMTDSIALVEIRQSIRDREIELGRLQEKMEQSMDQSLPGASGRIPSITRVQKSLSRNSALLSYHLSEDELLILCIRSGRVSYRKLEAGEKWLNRVRSYAAALRDFNREPATDTLAVHLYSWLMEPVLDLVRDCNQLLVIPDDELNLLPFEALKNRQGQYLVEQFAVQYQYSAMLFEKAGTHPKRKKVLSFAPFAGDGTADFTQLEYSGDEIAGLPGISFSGAAATKKQFIAHVNRYPVLHLATHAAVNDTLPLMSYIAFNPADSGHLLYAREIYDLDLDSTSLVILSACETGAGQLVHGEGLMSLTRAFAYAGCPDIVTSFWKAEDKSTAFIMKGLHRYLSRGYTVSRALRQARIDLLKSDEIDPRLKSPHYWAHLVFIGAYEKEKSAGWTWWAGGILLLIVAAWIVSKKGISRKS